MMAGDASSCAQVVDSAVDEVIAGGRFEQVTPYLVAEGGDPDRPIALVLRSKIELGHGNYERAAHWAQVATASAAGTADAGLTLLNLASILGAGGPVEEAVAAARLALDGDLSETQRDVAQASLALWEASEEGDLLEIADPEVGEATGARWAKPLRGHLAPESPGLPLARRDVRGRTRSWVR